MSAAAGADVDIEIEVESLDELQTALAGGAESILLDNFGSRRPATMAVAMCAAARSWKASGGVTLDDSGHCCNRRSTVSPSVR